MRKAFARAILNHWNTEDCFFLTGDLGFMALEEVRSAFGARFVNAGVSEQNMIGVAAGLAREGYRVFVYSIAPFSYARPFEQIRNDLCFSSLPVCIVGNGGGYAYGNMGPTHHALEDCAALTALGVKVLVPAFDEDVASLMATTSGPAYLRLGFDERPAGAVAMSYAPWREVLAGSAGMLAALGPLAGVAWRALADLPEEQRPSVWAVTEFGAGEIPEAIWARTAREPFYVIEEHVASGGLGMHISLEIVRRGANVKKFVHRPSIGYPSGMYGSQQFHRAECGLDDSGIRSMITGK